MGLTAIYTIVVLTGLRILIIGLNEMVTVVIIIVKATGVDQARVTVGGLQPWIQTLQHHRLKTCRKRQEEEERDEKAQNNGRERKNGKQCAFLRY